MEISITEELSRFKNHIQPSKNSKIILSGIFGIGKTTFIEEFFNENAEVYTPFFISPVNYSIAQNEDILKLIKYDIIFEILKNGSVEFEFEKFSLSETNQFYLKENYTHLLRSIVKHFGKIGKSVSEIMNDIQQLQKDMVQFNKKYNVDEKADLQKFLEDISNESGSIYEEDTITQIISNIISKLKKPPVLVIDDFDRLDPEHIFRLLNIFSCHLSTDNTYNKFGFHKIILVCDISNIKAIFSHKYGKKADFVGYLDKFYSNEIFYLDNKVSFKRYISNHIKKFDNLVLDEPSKGIIIIILQDLVELNLFNIRQIKEKVNDSFEFINRNKYFQTDGKRYISGEGQGNTKDNSFCLAINFLASIYGGINNLSDIFEIYKNCTYETNSSDSYYLSIVIDFLRFTTEKYLINDILIFEDLDLRIQTSYNNEIIPKLIKTEFYDNRAGINKSLLPHPQIIYKAFENFKNLNYWMDE